MNSLREGRDEIKFIDLYRKIIQLSQGQCTLVLQLRMKDTLFRTDKEVSIVYLFDISESSPISFLDLEGSVVYGYYIK